MIRDCKLLPAVRSTVRTAAQRQQEAGGLDGAVDQQKDSEPKNE